MISNIMPKYNIIKIGFYEMKKSLLPQSLGKSKKVKYTNNNNIEHTFEL